MRSLRRKRFSHPPISFFPFLDILGGTIGVLILIVAVFTMQISPTRKTVQLLASDSHDEQQKSPSYIICNGNGLAEVYHEREKALLSVDSSKIANVINDIKLQSNRRYLIIGVRPSGYSDFQKVRSFAEAAGISIGYEPIDEDWKVRVPRGQGAN